MFTLRSCASSTMSAQYCESSGSPWVSASRMPSVISLIAVSARALSWKRTLYPTSPPSSVPSSSAMRVATLRAATRRGWVWPMRCPRAPALISSRILGSCVVLPEPVSPHTTMAWCRSSAARISSRRALTGSAGSKRIARLMNWAESYKVAHANRRDVHGRKSRGITQRYGADSAGRRVSAARQWRRNLQRGQQGSAGERGGAPAPLPVRGRGRAPFFLCPQSRGTRHMGSGARPEYQLHVLAGERLQRALQLVLVGHLDREKRVGMRGMAGPGDDHRDVADLRTLLVDRHEIAAGDVASRHLRGDERAAQQLLRRARQQESVSGDADAERRADEAEFPLARKQRGGVLQAPGGRGQHDGKGTASEV